MSPTPTLRDGDRHLTPTAYYWLATLAAVIGLCASYVTVRLFALAISATEQDGPGRELLTLTAGLFVAAELAACFIAGLVPVHRLRTLRWQLGACAVALLTFEAVSIYGARVTLARASDGHAAAQEARAQHLRASIEAQRRSAAALVEAGQRSSQSVIPSSRADGARSLRDAAELETQAQRLATELVRIESARAPTATSVFGASGVIVLAVAQSLLISSIGLLFLGAAGALARAARDARGTETPMHRAALADFSADVPTANAAAAPVRAQMAVEQSQGTPAGTVPAVPSRLHHYALPSLAAGAGMLACGPAMAAAMPMQPQAPSAAPDAPADAATSAVPMQQAGDDEDRFLRVREGIETGRVKPSLRSIYAAEGASQRVARRYLAELERAGVIEQQGRGYRLATSTGKATT